MIHSLADKGVGTAARFAAFIEDYVTRSGRVGYNDQTSYALAILHDLAIVRAIADSVAVMLEGRPVRVDIRGSGESEGVIDGDYTPRR